MYTVVVWHERGLDLLEVRTLREAARLISSRNIRTAAVFRGMPVMKEGHTRG
jgi:hypothetical protein